jgi:hypothetical protein
MSFRPVEQPSLYDYVTCDDIAGIWKITFIVANKATLESEDAMFLITRPLAALHVVSDLVLPRVKRLRPG